MISSNKAIFRQNYALHVKHLRLKGLQPKTIDAYARAIRRIGIYFDNKITDLSEKQLLDYFSSLLDTHSWSAVKLDLYGLKFYYQHVLCKRWTNIDLIKPPKATRLPDILSVDEASKVFKATEKLSYRVFFYTLYSLGLRIGEGLRLQVGDIDAGRQRVHIRDSKGNKDRFVPLPEATVIVLRKFWQVHRNPIWLFPNRKGGLKASSSASTPLDRGGVQTTLKIVVNACGVKKRLRHIVYDTAMQHI